MTNMKNTALSQRAASIALLALSLALGACASAPFKGASLEGADRNVTPAQVLSNPQAQQGKRVVWGGQIISSQNLAGMTELTILAYPLDARTTQPETGKASLGRFIIQQNGYLETADYAPGRQVSVVGSISGVRQASIGEASYRYPVVQAQQLHLWPRETESSYRGSPFHFGVGVGIGL